MWDFHHINPKISLHGKHSHNTVICKQILKSKGYEHKVTICLFVCKFLNPEDVKFASHKYIVTIFQNLVRSAAKSDTLEPEALQICINPKWI